MYSFLDLGCSAMLLGADWQLLTDISGQNIGPEKSVTNWDAA
jgi:hypothetical protein